MILTWRGRGGPRGRGVPTVHMRAAPDRPPAEQSGDTVAGPGTLPAGSVGRRLRARALSTRLAAGAETPDKPRSAARPHAKADTETREWREVPLPYQVAGHVHVTVRATRGRAQSTALRQHIWSGRSAASLGCAPASMPAAPRVPFAMAWWRLRNGGGPTAVTEQGRPVPACEQNPLALERASRGRRRGPTRIGPCLQDAEWPLPGRARGERSRDTRRVVPLRRRRPRAHPGVALDGGVGRQQRGAKR